MYRIRRFSRKTQKSLNNFISSSKYRVLGTEFFLQGGVKGVSFVDFNIGILLTVVSALGIQLFERNTPEEPFGSDSSTTRYTTEGLTESLDSYVVYNGRVETENSTVVIYKGSLQYYTVLTCWSYSVIYYFFAVIVSPFLYRAADKRNGRHCKKFLNVSVGMFALWIVNNVLYYIYNNFATNLYKILHVNLNLYLFVYKCFALYLVKQFCNEINTLGCLNQSLRCLTDAEIQDFLTGNPSSKGYSAVGDGDAQSLPYNVDYEICERNLNIDEENPLGSGTFGNVYMAMLKDESGEICRAVAVKVLKAEIGIQQFKAVLAELKIMTNVGKHPNIVNLIGACTSSIRERKLLIVVEFCPYGNMKSFLQAHRAFFCNQVNNDRVQPGYIWISNDDDEATDGTSLVTTIDLIKWSREMAQGMEYLASKKIVHGDLAARNMLLSREKTIKISDFGLSKQLYEYSNFVKSDDDPLPWRWLAIESLTDLVFSTASDVWAFGITLWEIFSLAQTPYPGVRWSSEFVQELQNGLKMQQPAYATSEIYKIMLQCWTLDSKERPSFTDIYTSLDNLIPKCGGATYVKIDGMFAPS